MLQVTRSLDFAEGGVARTTVELSRHLAELGVNVTVVFLRPRRDVPEVSGCRLISAGRFLPMLRALWAESEDCDLIHSQGIWDPSHTAAWVVARLRRRPLIVSEHGALHPADLARKAWKKRIFALLLERRILRQAVWVQALTAKGVEHVERFAPGSRTELLSSGVSRPATAQPVAVETHPPTVLFLGRLHPVKGLDVLLEAFALVGQQHPSAVLRIVGPGSEAMLRGLQEQARRLPCRDRVRFEPAVLGEDRWRLLREADIFILPARNDGFSLALLEAMACGLPTVTSDRCNFDVAECGAGLRVPLTAAALADALLRLLRDPAHARALGERGRQLAEERYLWEVIAERQLHLYRRVLGGAEALAVGSGD